MRWPTPNGRPIRRATFGHAIATDEAMRDIRFRMPARDLAAVDWILYRRNCNPFRPGGPAHGAYERAFARERIELRHLTLPPIPDLARSRPRIGTLQND